MSIISAIGDVLTEIFISVVIPLVGLAYSSDQILWFLAKILFLFVACFLIYSYLIYPIRRRINPAIDRSRKCKELYGQGNALYLQGRYDEAIQTYDETIKLDSNYIDAWNSKSVALNRLERYDEAIEVCDKATEIDPRCATPWYIKGLALSHLKRYDDAIKAYDKAIEINPTWAMPWDSKGNSLVAQGKHDEAIETYDKAIDIFPTWEIP